MVTVVLRCCLSLPQVDSLKEKRGILKSLIARLRNDFNISVSEIADNDTLRAATIGVAVISNSGNYSHRVIQKVIRRIESDFRVVLGDVTVESY